MSVNLSTVQKWVTELDHLGEWLHYDESSEKVTRFFCVLCAKYKDRLHAIRNFSSSFVDGISGTALKKDNVKKHRHSEQHSKAVSLEHKPTTHN